jgi:hypothetical protein
VSTPTKTPLAAAGVRIAFCLEAGQKADPGRGSGSLPELPQASVILSSRNWSEKHYPRIKRSHHTKEAANANALVRKRADLSSLVSRMERFPHTVRKK